MKASTFTPKLKQKLDMPDRQLRLDPVVGKRDHDYYKLYYKGKFVVLVKVSRGSKEWGNGLLKLVAHNLGISISQLDGIVSCSFGTEDFISKSRLLADI